MQLTEREREKMLISLAAMIAQRRKDAGLKLNHPESVALITDHILEGARAGKSVADMMKEGRE
ncbi:MAG: urease subunit gamma, partial [Veillonellaceae bacterium]|nr:urease subunit gamma [Veillonellaceae bacterium]